MVRVSGSMVQCLWVWVFRIWGSGLIGGAFAFRIVGVLIFLVIHGPRFGELWVAIVFRTSFNWAHYVSTIFKFKDSK